MLPYVLLIAVIGLADSVTAAYVVLFASDDLGLDPVQTGAATTVAVVSGIVLGVIAGRSADRRRSRVPLALVLLVAAVGFALLVVVRGFVPLLLVCVLAGAINVGFPQVFALERMRAGASGEQRAAAMLRAVWSVSWAIGPVAGSGLVLWAGYRTLFGVGAVLLGVGALTVTRLARPTAAGHELEAGSIPLRSAAVVLPVLAVLLFHAAMFIGSFVLPLFLTRDLHASDGWVGVVFGVAAAVEVIAALALAAWSTRITARATLVFAAAAMAVYFVGMVVAPGLVAVIALQVARGAAVAAMGIAGIALFQRLLAPNVAGATALFANALATGSIVSGITAGALVQFLGTRPAMVVCAVLAIGAVACVAAGVRSRVAIPVSSRE